MWRLPGIAVASLLVAAGCGSDEHFRLRATRSSLDQRGYTAAIENNWIFKPSDGSLVVQFGRRYVALNFGRDEREARSVRDAALQANARWPIAVRANGAYVWSVGTKDRVAAVVDCLRS
jgi:hypothetical protein